MASHDDSIPGRTWTDGASGLSLVVEESNPGDIYVAVWIDLDDGDGPSVLLTLAQIRELAEALADRLSLLEGD